MSGLKRLAAIACVRADDFAIGFKNVLLYKFPSDLQRFKYVTSRVPQPGLQQNAVIMGRNTWESMSQKVLPNRLNIILTSKLNGSLQQGTVEYSKTFQDAMQCATSNNTVHRIFAIGGEAVYREALIHPNCETVYLTKVIPAAPRMRIQRPRRAAQMSYFPGDLLGLHFELVTSDLHENVCSHTVPDSQLYNLHFQTWMRK